MVKKEYNTISWSTTAPFQYTKENIDYFFNTLKCGDIVLAKRYKNDEQKSLIPEGHEKGPFVVIDVFQQEILAAPATGTVPKAKVSRFFLCLKQNDYVSTLKKDTFVNVQQIRLLKKDRLIRRLGCLTPQDTHYLEKRMNILASQYPDLQNQSGIPSIPFEPGDIIRINDSFYLIVEKERGTYKMIELSTSKEEDTKDSFRLNGITYYYNKGTTKLIKANNGFTRYDFLDEEKTKFILSLTNKAIRLSENKNTIQRGSVIKANDGRCFYIYGEAGQNWLAFELLECRNHPQLTVNFQERKYHAKFNSQMNFAKTDTSIQLVVNATSEEMEAVKKIKKSYQKLHKSKDKSQSFDVEFISGHIIADKNDERKRYVVILTYPTSVIAIKEEDFACLNYKAIQLDPTRFKYVSTVDTRNLRYALTFIQEKSIENFSKKGIAKELKLIEQK